MGSRGYRPWRVQGGALVGRGGEELVNQFRFWCRGQSRLGTGPGISRWSGEISSAWPLPRAAEAVSSPPGHRPRRAVWCFAAAQASRSRLGNAVFSAAVRRIRVMLWVKARHLTKVLTFATPRTGT